ncbi:hypothetical protein M3J09_009894 [Ascochyta lentis]
MRRIQKRPSTQQGLKHNVNVRTNEPTHLISSVMGSEKHLNEPRVIDLEPGIIVHTPYACDYVTLSHKPHSEPVTCTS